ncbi:hypothetical protein [Rubidibacter lacunae]|uniref:hypothetical protein n=1 Tax=Rubidibacter lacunae TaxID=582514 RepID=UPI0012EB5642|nr:hypothetical protein [Rubidibacter lacunae]
MPNRKFPLLFQTWMQSDRDPGQSQLDIVGLAAKHPAQHQQVSGVCRHQRQNPVLRAGRACDERWNIKVFHREVKPVFDIERDRYRKNRSQHNPIAFALLVRVLFLEIAYRTGQTVDRLKQGLLKDFLLELLKRPSTALAVASVPK